MMQIPVFENLVDIKVEVLHADSFTERSILRHAYCRNGTRRSIICVKEFALSGLTATDVAPILDAYDWIVRET
jgi:protein tyrosine phosphatase (PTP) superfamily phosphohydrolase (DUF442 family)